MIATRDSAQIVLFVDLVEGVTVVFVDHGHPATKPVSAPAFLLVDEHGVF